VLAAVAVELVVVVVTASVAVVIGVIDATTATAFVPRDNH
jgi:hypothetical protein